MTWEKFELFLCIFNNKYVSKNKKCSYFADILSITLITHQFLSAKIIMAYNIIIMIIMT
jgi:hypothetical protein